VADDADDVRCDFSTRWLVTLSMPKVDHWRSWLMALTISDGTPRRSGWCYVHARGDPQQVAEKAGEDRVAAATM
jgi:hypothetical protein